MPWSIPGIQHFTGWTLYDRYTLHAACCFHRWGLKHLLAQDEWKVFPVSRERSCLLGRRLYSSASDRQAVKRLTRFFIAYWFCSISLMNPSSYGIYEPSVCLADSECRKSAGALIWKVESFCHLNSDERMIVVCPLKPWVCRSICRYLVILNRAWWPQILTVGARLMRRWRDVCLQGSLWEGGESWEKTKSNFPTSRDISSSFCYVEVYITYPFETESEIMCKHGFHDGVGRRGYLSRALLAVVMRHLISDQVVAEDFIWLTFLGSTHRFDKSLFCTLCSLINDFRRTASTASLLVRFLVFINHK